jgi:hypothetical protein
MDYKPWPKQLSRYNNWLLAGRPRGQEFSLLCDVHIGSGNHLASYPTSQLVSWTLVSEGK